MARLHVITTFFLLATVLVVHVASSRKVPSVEHANAPNDHQVFEHANVGLRAVSPSGSAGVGDKKNFVYGGGGGFAGVGGYAGVGVLGGGIGKFGGIGGAAGIGGLGGGGVAGLGARGGGAGGLGGAGGGDGGSGSAVGAGGCKSVQSQP